MDSDGPSGPQPLRVIVTDTSGRPVRDPGVAKWLRDNAPPSARGGQMGFVVASDSTVRRLNREFAGVDRATDVLSFPSFEPKRAARRRTRGPVWLGDVVVARGVAARQAASAGHSLRSELRILALHGLLHLLGYDHETDDGKMERLERRLRRQGGLGEGLIERSANRHGMKGRRS